MGACATVFGDLVKTLNKLYHAQESGDVEFERVVIETSGLADLSPVLQAFLSDPTLEGLFRVAGVVATVDAVNGPNTLSAHTVSVGQVALADHILITKSDLLPVSDRTQVLESLTQRLRRLNGSGSIAAADAPGIDPIQLILQSRPDPARGGQHVIEWLKGVTDDGNTSYVQVQRQATHLHDPTIASFSLIRDTPLSRDGLSLLLSSLEHHLGAGLLRVKGLVNVAEEPEQPAVIQGAQHLLHNLTWLTQWPDADRRTRVVFITQGIEPADLEEMVGLLERVATRTAAARQRASRSALLPETKGKILEA